jgi:hypothetical protein
VWRNGTRSAGDPLRSSAEALRADPVGRPPSSSTRTKRRTGLWARALRESGFGGRLGIGCGHNLLVWQPVSVIGSVTVESRRVLVSHPDLLSDFRGDP